MDDHTLSEAEFSRYRIAIVGSRSLTKYSTKMLAHGFSELGWDVVPLADADYAIIQLHGAPHSKEDDEAILRIDLSHLRRATFLIHRPDEILTHCPRAHSFLSRSHPQGPIVLLGDLHTRDSFVSSSSRPVAVISHGFYSSRRPGPKIQIPPVVGSHTSWGEMRRVEDTVHLLIELFKRVEPGAVIGYVGGAALEGELSIDTIERLLASYDLPFEVTVTESHGQVQNARMKHVIVVNATNTCPPELTPLFNVQLYHLRGRIRTGESSGSVHEYPCIPVIVEMNGAERLEELEVIKLPYLNQADINSVDFASGAEQIAAAIQSRRVKTMLSRNIDAAKRLSPHEIAKCHAMFLLDEAWRMS